MDETAGRGAARVVIIENDFDDDTSRARPNHRAAVAPPSICLPIIAIAR